MEYLIYGELSRIDSLQIAGATKALLHGAINCAYNCNRVAATFECAITHRQSV